MGHMASFLLTASPTHTIPFLPSYKKKMEKKRITNQHHHLFKNQNQNITSPTPDRNSVAPTPTGISTSTHPLTQNYTYYCFFVFIYYTMYSGACSCGGDMFEPCNCSSSSSLSLFYPNSSSDPYPSSSSSVDCTLSLGTPSTRRTERDDNGRHRQQLSGFCGWDVIRASPPRQAQQQRNGRSGGSTSSGDGLFTRRCANCDTTSTPLWRNGPMGPKSLCNACGIRHKKEEKRAAASVGGGGQQEVVNGFMSWRLNVADGSTGFFHDFTR